MNALAKKEVGDYLNENFVSSFQKVATFRIVNGQKQGGNVASYFCAPDGRVLHVVAGPVNATTLVHEAKWVVESTKKAMAESKGDGAKFKALFRKWHADRLRQEHGLVVEPVTYDPPKEDPKSALTYRDPSGRPLAPKLPPPPIDGPDVKFDLALEREAKADGAAPIADRRGRSWTLGNQGRVHMLMAGHAMVKIEDLYGTIFERILGEKVSTKPVDIVTPFPWRQFKE
ncbi:MAG TPA: hypothetical protein VG013_37585 [Gemmataceae bacterium]|nr:hypothetical protein [Gemmataceae bacterium]